MGRRLPLLSSQSQEKKRGSETKEYSNKYWQKFTPQVWPVTQVRRFQRLSTPQISLTNKPMLKPIIIDMLKAQTNEESWKCLQRHYESFRGNTDFSSSHGGQNKVARYFSRAETKQSRTTWLWGCARGIHPSAISLLCEHRRAHLLKPRWSSLPHA